MTTSKKPTRMPITRRRWFSLVAAPVGLLLWLPVFAVPAACTSREAPYALIFGTVWGPGEHPLYGVHVRLRRAGEKKFRWEASSDHHGEFAIRVPAGKQDYVLVPDLKRGKDKPLPETHLHVDDDERLDIGVHLEE
jgi:hypothetical protein